MLLDYNSLSDKDVFSTAIGWRCTVDWKFPLATTNGKQRRTRYNTLTEIGPGVFTQCFDAYADYNRKVKYSVDLSFARTREQWFRMRYQFKIELSPHDADLGWTEYFSTDGKRWVQKKDYSFT